MTPDAWRKEGTMQHTHSAAPSTTDCPHTPPETAHVLYLDATISISDPAGVAVEAPSLHDALTVIRSRSASTPMTVRISSHHLEAQPELATTVYRVTDTGLEPTEEQSAGYELHYQEFRLIDGTEDVRARHLEAIAHAATQLATTRGAAISLISDLPGIASRDFTPQPIENTDAREEDDADTQQLPAVEAPEPTPSKILRLRRTLAHRFKLARRRLAAIKLPRVSISKPALIIGLAAFLVVGLLAGTVTVINHTATADDHLTPAAELTVTDSPLETDYTHKAWTLDAAKSKTLTWSQAGLAYVDPANGHLTLADPTTGKPRGNVGLDSPISFTSEFMAGNTPALAARTKTKLYAITADGKTQAWPTATDDRVSIKGTTPMLTTREGTHYALTIESDKPQQVKADSPGQVIGIDGTDLLAQASTQPTIYRTPINGGDTAKLHLAAPIDGATFERHLGTGHGLTAALWTHDGDHLAVVYQLTDTAPAPVTTRPAPADIEDWTIRRGLERITLDDSIINAADGTLVATIDPTAVLAVTGRVVETSRDGQRLYSTDTNAHPAEHRILGMNTDVLVIRNEDGTTTGMTPLKGEEQ